MENILDESLKKQFESLPVEIQEAISAVDLPSKLQEIVKNNKLMIDQAGALGIETTLVLLGIEPLGNYVDNLVKNVGLSNAQASTVAHDVDELVFKKIRESLQKSIAQEQEQEKDLEETANEPSKEEILAEIEQSEKKEAGGTEIKMNRLPEIAPEINPPAISSLTSKPAEPFHQNIAPVENIVESKLTSTVAVPKETVIVEEKTKLPEKPRLSTDPYRESII